MKKYLVICMLVAGGVGALALLLLLPLLVTQQSPHLIDAVVGIAIGNFAVLVISAFTYIVIITEEDVK